MVCEPCKVAARLLLEARAQLFTRPGNRAFLAAEAADRHCASKTCTCQHRIAMNRKDVIAGGV